MLRKLRVHLLNLLLLPLLESRNPRLRHFLLRGGAGGAFGAGLGFAAGSGAGAAAFSLSGGAAASLFLRSTAALYSFRSSARSWDFWTASAAACASGEAGRGAAAVGATAGANKSRSLARGETGSPTARAARSKTLIAAHADC